MKDQALFSSKDKSKNLLTPKAPHKIAADDILIDLMASY